MYYSIVMEHTGKINVKKIHKQHTNKPHTQHLYHTHTHTNTLHTQNTDKQHIHNLLPRKGQTKSSGDEDRKLASEF